MRFDLFHRMILAAEASALPSAEPSAQPSEDIGAALQKWDQDTFAMGGLVNTIIYAAIVAAVALILITILRRVAKKKLTGNLRIFYHLLYAAIVVIAVIAVLVTIKPLNSLGNAILASSGIAGVVVGLAAQQTLGNVFSGLSISSAKPFEVGDYIEILDVSPTITGTVKDIALRQTIILDGATNKCVVIPNSVLDTKVVRAFRKEYTAVDAVCSYLEVGIAYNSDIPKGLRILAETVGAHPNYVDVRTDEQKKAGVPLVTVRVQDLGNSAVTLRAFVWTKDTIISFSTLGDLRQSVKAAYDKAGINIPFPCRTVYLYNQPDGK